MVELWTQVQSSWGTLVLLAGYSPLALGLYKARLELQKMKVEIAELQAKIAERESRIEKVSLADITKYARNSMVFDDIESGEPLPCVVFMDGVNIQPTFAQLYQPEEEYRATEIVLIRLEAARMVQLDLFGEVLKAEQCLQVYQAVDHLREQFGKHTVFWGSSYLVQKIVQHASMRSDASERTRQRFTGETKRQRVAIPMFLGQVT